jgi:hypothetical protein
MHVLPTALPNVLDRSPWTNHRSDGGIEGAAWGLITRLLPLVAPR